MGGVTSHQLQAVSYGNRRNHWIAAADRPADTIEVASDQAGQVSGALVEGKDFLWKDGGAKRLDAFWRGSDFLQALNDLHHCDNRQSQAAHGQPICGRIAGNGLVDGFEDFGIDVGVEKGLIQRCSAAKAAPL